MTADLSVSGGQRLALNVHRNEINGGWRMVVQVRSDRRKTKPIELRAVLRNGDSPERNMELHRSAETDGNGRAGHGAARRAHPDGGDSRGTPAPDRGARASALSQAGSSPLEVAAARRRFVLLLLSLAPALYATHVMSDLLPDHGRTAGCRARCWCCSRCFPAGWRLASGPRWQDCWCGAARWRPRF